MPMFSLDFGYRKSVDSKRRASHSMDSLQGSLKDAFGQPHYRSAVEAKGRLDFGELELELWDSRYHRLRDYKHSKWSGCCKPSCIPISIVTVLISLVVLLSLLDQRSEHLRREELIMHQKELVECQQSCKMTVVESIPEGLVFNTTVKHPSTYDAWTELLNLAQHTIDIGSLYWELRAKDYPHPSSDKGADIFQRLMTTGLGSKVKIRIAQNVDSESFPNEDAHELASAGAAEVRQLNFTRFLGDGILHTKFWIVDSKHAYIGSANFDWRSLTQVKELGLLVTNCSCFAKDLMKIFEVYWELGRNDSAIPAQWPPAFDTKYNVKSPMKIAFNNTPYDAYLSSSPPPLCPHGRTSDIDSILDIINNSAQFVHISVMEYMPATIYTPRPRFWPVIDDSLRKAAINRGVSVKLLISKWNHTMPSAYNYLYSLQDLNRVYPHVDIQIKLFEVASTPEQAQIPFARVNHDKYMVTDRAAYVGTSNWSADYFIYDAGVGVILFPKHNATQNDVRQQVENVFERDWNSPYALDLKRIN